MRSLNGESLEVSFIEYSSYREVVWIAHDTSISGKPTPTRPIVKTRSLEQIGKLSSMILRYVNLVMTICSQKSFTLNHPISSEYQSLSRNSRFLCVSPHLKHNLSAVEKYLRKSYSNLSPIQKEKR